MIIWFFCVKLYYSSEKTSCICKEYIYLFFLHRKRPPCESIVKVRTVPHCFYKLMRGGLFPYFTVIVPLFVVNLIRLSPSPMTVDRKSTRLNSSHVAISYAGFCLNKKKKIWASLQTQMRLRCS